MSEDPTYMTDEELGLAREDELAERRRRRLAFVLTSILIVIVIIVLILILGIVPRTVGMSRERSELLIERAGFESVVTTVTTGESAAGRVVAQEPLWGLRFIWFDVHITVGASPGATSARGTFGARTYDGDYRLPLGDDSGTEQMPDDAEEMDPLFVRTVVGELLMPNVQNMTRANALKALHEVGVRSSFKSGPSTTDVAAGRVYYQSPAPGSKIAVGESAVIWISTGPFDNAKGDEWEYPSPVPGH